jgi:hypothetical protein
MTSARSVIDAFRRAKEAGDRRRAAEARVSGPNHRHRPSEGELLGSQLDISISDDETEQATVHTAPTRNTQFVKPLVSDD